MHLHTNLREKQLSSQLSLINTNLFCSLLTDKQFHELGSQAPCAVHRGALGRRRCSDSFRHSGRLQWTHLRLLSRYGSLTSCIKIFRCPKIPNGITHRLRFVLLQKRESLKGGLHLEVDHLTWTVSRILVPEIPFRTMSEEKRFTLEEVAERTNSTSYLLVIHNRVYDVTSFISEVSNYSVVVLY